jgi:hypothetical protein
MARYASQTTVSVINSKAEIEKTITRYGANNFASGWDKDRGMAMVQFTLSDRVIRFLIPLPDPKDKEFTTTETGRDRNPNAAEKAWEQAQRQRWRALNLAIKAKLEMIDSGIETVEQAFCAHIVLPDGSTVGEFVIPQIALAYERKEMPSILPMLEAPETMK